MDGVRDKESVRLGLLALTEGVAVGWLTIQAWDRGQNGSGMTAKEAAWAFGYYVCCFLERHPHAVPVFIFS